MAYELDESDWKLFRERIPVWQERFMGKLVDDYATLLSSDKKASEIFWELVERIDSDKRKRGVIIDKRRSQMLNDLIRLRLEGAIDKEDLHGFNESLVEIIESTYDELRDRP